MHFSKSSIIPWMYVSKAPSCTPDFCVKTPFFKVSIFPSGLTGWFLDFLVVFYSHMYSKFKLLQSGTTLLSHTVCDHEMKISESVDCTLWSFQWGDTNCSQIKLSNSENWSSGECSKIRNLFIK